MSNRNKPTQCDNGMSELVRIQEFFDNMSDEEYENMLLRNLCDMKRCEAELSDEEFKQAYPSICLTFGDKK